MVAPDPPVYDAELYVRALRFAAEKHRAQTMPGNPPLPYVVHITSVAAELIAELPGERPTHVDVAVQCALLHDTLEDTDATEPELRALFGPAVADGVLALTKDPTLPKGTGMKDSLGRILMQPREVALVKIADRITNLAPPPPHWSREKCLAYRDEAQLIADELGSRSLTLVQKLRKRIAGYASLIPPAKS